MTSLPLALVGMGRMGAALAQLAPERGFTVVSTIGSGQPITRETLNGAAVAIDFTVPDAAPANVRACVQAGCPVVVGTTGWDAEVERTAQQVRGAGGAMLTAPNFSIGVAVFERVVAEAARLFATIEGFDGHLVETHHTAKKDAPSGTALLLARSAQAAGGRPMPITSVRVGRVPGTHAVVYDGAFEQVRLTHEARDRRVFAEGALLAARWLVGRRGVFTMHDVLSTPAPTDHA